MMTSLKTWCLLPLAVLLLLSITPTVAEVVQLMSDCKEFLLEEKTPEVPDILNDGEVVDHNRYKTICQTFNDERRFLTLYDTENKIPVFSAYKYRGSQGGKPNTHWKMEPQLEDINKGKNMKICDRGVEYNQQASDADYSGGQYDRGHLFPKSYGFERSDKTSTVTLTNVVPQVPSFNKQSWSKIESCVKCIMDEYCIENDDKEGFVVTGAKASEDNTMRGVNVPSMLWSAFCCYSGKLNEWIASAYWGDNVDETSNTVYIRLRTLEDLSKELSTGNKTFEAFPGTSCPVKQTVAEFYPQMNGEHKCFVQADKGLKKAHG